MLADLKRILDEPEEPQRWWYEPSKFGLVSINEAYMSDLHKPKLIRPTDSDRRQARVHRSAA